MRFLCIWLTFVSIGCSSIIKKKLRFFASENSDQVCNHENIESIDDMPVNHNIMGKTFRYFYQRKLVNPNTITIVHLPGGPGNTGIGRNFLPKDFNWIQIDPRGVGCNTASEINPKSDMILTEQAAMDVIELIRRLEINTYIIYGESYGTVLATIIAGKLARSSLPNPQAVVLEGTVGKAYRSWDTWNEEHLRQANSFLNMHPKIKELFNNTNEPFGYPADFWGRQLFYVGHLWKHNETLYKGLLQGSPHALNIIQGRYKSWEANANQNYMPDEFYVYLTCRELSPTLYLNSPIPIVEKGVLKMIERNPRINLCTDIPFDHSYDSKKYQIKAPLFYFQGTKDPITPLEGAIYHMDNQKNTQSKQLIQVKLGGHNPLTEDLRSCNSQIWGLIASDKKNISSVLNQDGFCQEQ